MQWSFTASLLQPPWPESVEPAPPPAQRAKLLSQRGAHEWEATSWEKFSANVCSMALKYSADLWAINEHLRHNSSLNRGRWPPVSCGSQSNKYRVLDYKPRVLPVGSLLPAPLSSTSSGSFSLVPFIHLSQCFWFKHMALLTKKSSPPAGRATQSSEDVTSLLMRKPNSFTKHPKLVHSAKPPRKKTHIFEDLRS